MSSEALATCKPPLQVEVAPGLPTDWLQATLGDIITLEYGRSLPDKLRRAGDVAVYGSNGVVGAHDEALVPTGGIIVGRKGTAGSVTVSPGPFWPIDTTYFVKARQTVDWEWLAATLHHARLNELNEATGVPGLNRDKAYRQSVLLPPLDEQRRIAEVLRSVDEAIAAKSAAITQAKRVLSTVRDTLLQPYGPGSDQVPDRWQNTQLGEVCRLWNGRAYKKEELLEVGKYLVLRVGNFFTNDRWYYSDLELEDEKYCDAGDLLYAWSASFGPRVWAGGKVIYHYHIWKITVDDRLIDKDFLFHFLDWDAEQIKSSLGSGSTMIHVTKGAMEQRAISLPPLDEQRRIANTLAAIHKSINLAKADLERASQMKVAVMAALLSGHVRVPA